MTVDLAHVLVGAGLIVVQYPNWRNRAVTSKKPPHRPYPFAPVGVLVHDDVIKGGDPAHTARYLAEGQRDDGLRSPFYNAWVDREGVWWLLAAGNCNHAGEGDQRALDLISFDHPPVKGTNTREDVVGNPHLLGVCLAWHPDDGLHPSEQLTSLERGLAAICLAEGWTADRVWRHAEFTDRKPDAHLDGGLLRLATATFMEDDMPLSDEDIEKIADKVIAKLGEDVPTTKAAERLKKAAHASQHVHDHFKLTD